MTFENKNEVKSIIPTALLVIRHLTTTDNVNLLYGSGDSDSDLLPGQTLDPIVIEKLKEALLGEFIIVHTGLIRTIKTADMLAAELNYTGEIFEIQDFKERFAGQFAGKSMENLYNKFPQVMSPNQHWLAEDASMGLESIEHFLARLSIALELIYSVANGRDIVLVAHAGTIKGVKALEEKPENRLDILTGPTPNNGNIFRITI